MKSTHTAILDAIRKSEGGVKAAQKACEAMAIHLCSAFIGHNLDARERKDTAKVMTELGDKLKRMWQNRK